MASPEEQESGYAELMLGSSPAARIVEAIPLGMTALSRASADIWVRKDQVT